MAEKDFDKIYKELLEKRAKLDFAKEKWSRASTKEEKAKIEKEINALEEEHSQLGKRWKNFHDEVHNDLKSSLQEQKSQAKESRKLEGKKVTRLNNFAGMLEDIQKRIKGLETRKKGYELAQDHDKVNALEEDLQIARAELKEARQRYEQAEKELNQHQENAANAEQKARSTEESMLAAKAQRESAEQELKIKREEAGILKKLFPTIGAAAKATADAAKATHKLYREKGVKGLAKGGAKAAGRGALAVGSYNVGKAAKGAVKNVISDTQSFADWLVLQGFIYHIYTGVATGWSFNEIPRQVITLEFSLIMVWTVLSLMTLKNLRERFSKIGVMALLFVIDWQWGRIISLLATGGFVDASSWFLSKLIWPTWIIGGIVMALRSGERRSWLMKFSLGALMLFWTTVAISQSGIAGAVYEYGAEGVSEEVGAAGVSEVGEKTIEAIFGEELLREAKDICFKQGDFTAYRPEMLGRSQCVQTEYRRLVREKAEAQEYERITKARRDLLSRDRIDIDEFRVEEVISLAGLTQMRARLKFESTADPVNLEASALLKTSTMTKPGEGIPATEDNGMIETLPKDLTGITDQLKYGLEITATDINKNLSGYNNKIIFNIDIKDIDTQTDFPSIFMHERAYEELVKKYEGEKYPNEFAFYDSVFKKEDIIIKVKDIYPNNKKESVFREKLAGTNLGVANERGPVVVIRDDSEDSSMNLLSLGLKIFNTRSAMVNYNGEIIKVNSIEISLPQGMALVDASGNAPCPGVKPEETRLNVNGRNIYSLKTSELNKKPVLEKINKGTEDKPDKQTPIEHNCRINVNPLEFFGRSSSEIENINPKYLIENSKITAFMDFDYRISKTGRIDVKGET